MFPSDPAGKSGKFDDGAVTIPPILNPPIPAGPIGPVGPVLP